MVFLLWLDVFTFSRQDPAVLRYKFEGAQATCTNNMLAQACVRACVWACTGMLARSRFVLDQFRSFYDRWHPNSNSNSLLSLRHKIICFRAWFKPVRLSSFLIFICFFLNIYRLKFISNRKLSFAPDSNFVCRVDLSNIRSSDVSLQKPSDSTSTKSV